MKKEKNSQWSCLLYNFRFYPTVVGNHMSQHQICVARREWESRILQRIFRFVIIVYRSSSTRSRRANWYLSLSFVLRLIMIRVDYNRRHQRHLRQLDPHRWFLCCTCSTCLRTLAFSPRDPRSGNRTVICEWRTTRLYARSRHNQALDSSHPRISSLSQRPLLPCVVPPCLRTLVLASCSCLQLGSPMRCNKSL